MTPILVINNFCRFYQSNQPMQQTQTCSNCQKDIPLSKIGTHFGYCKRNVIKCSVCAQMYDKNFQEEHQEEFHMNQQCKYCSIKLKKKDQQSHSLICDMRPKICQYCEMDVPSLQFTTHLKTCESRTTECQFCKKPILNKQYGFHKLECLRTWGQKGYLKEQRKQESRQFELQDSLSEFKRQIKRQYNPEKAFKKEKKPEENNYLANKSKQDAISSKYLRTAQKKSQRTNEKEKRQRSSEKFFRKFVHDYLYPEDSFNDITDRFSSFYINDSIGELIRPSITKSQSCFSDSNDNIGQITVQEQLLQETLLQNTKKQMKGLKNLSKQLPSDFLSEDVMNSSFYAKDILDIQKQKAIEKEIEIIKKINKMNRRK